MGGQLKERTKRGGRPKQGGILKRGGRTKLAEMPVKGEAKAGCEA